MREILFRGKRKDTGEWVQGDFVSPCNIVFIEIGYDEVLDKSNVPILNDYEVIPETVGQFTGLTDKNGIKIFEGDILEYINTDDKPHRVKVIFEDGAFLINDDGIVDYDLITSYFCLGFRVVGNIHDNPELLGGCCSGFLTEEKTMKGSEIMKKSEADNIMLARFEQLNEMAKSNELSDAEKVDVIDSMHKLYITLINSGAIAPDSVAEDSGIIKS